MPYFRRDSQLDPARLKPDCGGCHAAIFIPTSHPSVVRVGGGGGGGAGVPISFYTVEELRNCTAECHIDNVNGMGNVISTTIIPPTHTPLGW